MKKFNYIVDNFKDVQILRYQVPGFENLSLRQKLLIFYLSKAAQAGRDIIYDQNGPYNLKIRQALEDIFKSSWFKKSKDWAEKDKFLNYLKYIWFSNGIYNNFTEDKIMPEFSKDWFLLACMKSKVKIDEQIINVIFNPNFMPKRKASGQNLDLVKNSFSNFYGPGVSQKEAEEWYKNHQSQEPEPESIGLNGRLYKNENGEINQEIFKLGGRYSKELSEVTEWLKLALEVSETDLQKDCLNHLISFYTTGDLKEFNKHCISWVKDTDSIVDFVNGFIETYIDPLGITGSWEGFVNFKNEKATERTKIISSNAQWFEDNSPTDPQFKKKNVTGVSAKVITTAFLGGDGYPNTFIGINLPNARWIRKQYGSKSVTIDNIINAYSEASKNNGFNEEFIIDQETKELCEKYETICHNIHVDLHECVGHGSGILLPNVTNESLKEYASTIEETRADLFALYFLADPKLVELNLLPNTEAYKAGYYKELMNGYLTQLGRIKLGKNLEEAHMKNRYLIASWIIQHSKVNENGIKDIEIIQENNKHFLHINNYQNVRGLIGQLLEIIQNITSTGNYMAAKELVENYATKPNPKIHQEIISRTQKLKLPKYKGFVNPKYIPVYQNNKIIDVKITYNENFIQQQLRYDKKGLN